MTDTSKTSNGVTITIGLRVFTNDWLWGTVVEAPAEWDERGWWTVELDNHGRRKTYNGDRMTTVRPR